MDTSILDQLMRCERAEIRREPNCCKRVYAIALPSGSQLVAEGLSQFCFQDHQGTPILDMRYLQPCCQLQKMEVKLCNSPPLRVRMKGVFSRSVLIFNDQDTPVLRVRRPFWNLLVCEIPILAENNIEIGKIKKDGWDYEVLFPVDLDVRYKAALLGSCVYMDFLNRTR